MAGTEALQGTQAQPPELSIKEQLIAYAESIAEVTPRDVAPAGGQTGAAIDESLKDYEGDLMAGNILQGLLIARKLGLAGKKQISEHLIVGEDEAIEATLATQLAGANLHYVSMFGGGKTKMLMYAHRLISGINRVATAPARADLKGGEFVGTSQGLILIERDPDSGKVTSKREISNTAEGIVNSRSQVLNLNEFPRIGQFAINAGFEIMESRMIETPDGYKYFPDLEYVVATSNPYTKGNRRNQFAYNPGSLSRFHQAVTMGDEKYWEDITGAISNDDFEPTPEDIEAAITLAELHLARIAIKEGIVWDDSQRKRMQKLSIAGARYIIHELDGEELPGRINVHLKQMTTATSAIRGQQKVTDGTLNDVFKRKMTSTLVGLRMKDNGEIDRHVERMLDAAA